MSVYIISDEIRHAKIRAANTEQSLDPSQPAPIFDQVGFDNRMNPYLLAADKIYTALYTKKGLESENIPVYTDVPGMSEVAIDMLRYYVYCKYFEDHPVIDIPSKDTGVKPSSYFCKKFKELYSNMSEYDLTNSPETEPKSNSSFGDRGGWF